MVDLESLRGEKYQLQNEIVDLEDRISRVTGTDEQSEFVRQTLTKTRKFKADRISMIDRAINEDPSIIIVSS